MTIRTTEDVVTFRRSFSIGKWREVFPPGDYMVETDEELIQGTTFSAYRHLRTLIHLPASSADPATHRTQLIDPRELEAALQNDDIAPPNQ